MKRKIKPAAYWQGLTAIEKQLLCAAVRKSRQQMVNIMSCGIAVSAATAVSIAKACGNKINGLDLISEENHEAFKKLMKDSRR